ncbi:2-phytyl-1,4-beta-naphthoquinone methyltransferase, chloroplastic [Sesamum angolense]|uniref:2-phytyl-1,4-beta-naphthoquinone methyltransferase, chloroplastic n=1 Tax=Sesamum angolense TaxID=2727404 RepID=A0AAE2BYT1_9LAMI|nr:2-phytyl-1,4-beta-naphthoquinone methyltransferase, chloroplastic [Sesamum angolense]
MATFRRRPESEAATHEGAAERQELFNRIAPVYDKLNDVFSLGMHKLWKRWSISWSGAKEGDKALDVCCGSGDLSFLLSQKVGVNGKVIALDFSKEQLQVAASRQRERSKSNPCYKNIEWFEGDAVNLPFPDSTFDAATIGYGLRNVIDRKKALEQMHRVLKPGAKLSVLDFNKSTSQYICTIQLVWTYKRVPIPEELNQGYLTGAFVSAQITYIYAVSILPNLSSNKTGAELEKLALEVGFSDAKHYEIAGGLMGNFVAKR